MLEIRNDLSKLFKPGAIIKHFKNNYYQMIGMGYHTETEETLVVYKSLSDNIILIRPYDMFISKVDKSKYPDAEQEYRFEVAEGEI